MKNKLYYLTYICVIAVFEIIMVITLPIDMKNGLFFRGDGYAGFVYFSGTVLPMIAAHIIGHTVLIIAKNCKTEE